MARTVIKDEQVFCAPTTFKQHTSAYADGVLRYQYFAETTTNTPVIVHAEALAELAGMQISVSAIAIKTDGTELLRAKYIRGFKRAASGDITADTASNTTVEDSSGSPTVTVAANTSDQTADVTLTTESAKTVRWQVTVEVEKIHA